MSSERMGYQYRCRRCTQVFVRDAVSDVQAAGGLLDASREIINENSPRLFGIHSCERGGWGLADLLGSEAVEEEEQP